MPYHPERGLGAADPGGHRTSGVSCRSYRTRLHRPEVSAVPETAAAPGPSERSGCRPPAPGGQPRIQYGAGSVKPDRDPAGRGGCPQGPSDGICERSIIHLIAIFFLSLLLRGAVGLVPYRRLAALRPGPAPWGGGVRGCQGSSRRSWMARAGGSLRFRSLLSSGVRMVSLPLRLQPGPAGVAPATRPGSGRCGRGSR